MSDDVRRTVTKPPWSLKPTCCSTSTLTRCHALNYDRECSGEDINLDKTNYL